MRINPGLWSAATGHHFARPGNRFWPTLHRAGFTPRQLRPDEQAELLRYRLGVTNLVARATARADERALVAQLRPRWLAVVGVTAYRVAFGDRTAALGRQPTRLGDTGLWMLPNPSGLNAHYSADALVAEFARLHEAAES